MSLCVAASVCGCSNDSVLAPRPWTTSVASYVTGNAAMALDAGGLFAPGSSLAGEMTRAQAEAYAHAWVTDVGALPEDLEQGRGPINFDRLRVCRQSVYAESSFEPLDSSVPTFIRGYAGGWWLVALCEGQTVEVSVAIEAIGTGLTLTNGHIGFLPDSNGGHFFVLGVPGWWDGPVPLSAEHAVIEAGRATGQLISQVPRLIAPSNLRGPPQVAVWQIDLDSNVVVRGAGTAQDAITTQVYEGLLRFAADDDASSTLVIPSPTQPTVQAVGAPFGQITLTVKPTTPIYFETATVMRK
jgi:hypothetical protein